MFYWNACYNKHINGYIILKSTDDSNINLCIRSSKIYVTNESKEWKRKSIDRWKIHLKPMCDNNINEWSQAIGLCGKYEWIYTAVYSRHIDQMFSVERRKEENKKFNNQSYRFTTAQNITHDFIYFI